MSVITLKAAISPYKSLETEVGGSSGCQQLLIRFRYTCMITAM